MALEDIIKKSVTRWLELELAQAKNLEQGWIFLEAKLKSKPVLAWACKDLRYPCYAWLKLRRKWDFELGSAWAR